MKKRLIVVLAVLLTMVGMKVFAEGHPETVSCDYCDNGQIHCSTCYGRGDIDCDKCMRSGTIPNYGRAYDDRNLFITCPKCNGNKTVSCSKCGGKGWYSCSRCGGKGYRVIWVDD